MVLEVVGVVVLVFFREAWAYVGHTEKSQNIVSVTMNLYETRGDRIPPMSHTFLRASRGKLSDSGGRGWGGAMYAVLPPDR